MVLKVKGSIMDPYLFQPKQTFTNKSQGPSLMDPYLFAPRPQAMQITPRYRQPPAHLGVKELLNNTSRKAAPIRQAAANAPLGITKAIRQFKESRSPAAQIKRTQEKMQEMKDKRDLIKLRETLLVGLCFLLVFGWGIALYAQEPSENQMVAVHDFVKLCKDSNVPCFNDWSVGWWVLVEGGTPSNKAGPPNPDYNRLSKPFVALTQDSLECTLLNSVWRLNTFRCD